MAYHGLEKYGKNHPIAKARIEKELKVIDELGFSGYFLITWDIIRYSKQYGIYAHCRGSGANSIIAYYLGITDICPIELDLYFERFLNSREKHRLISISTGPGKSGMLFSNISSIATAVSILAFCGTNVEFKYRSIFVEVGKVFGLPKDELDALAKSQCKTMTKKLHRGTCSKYGMMLEKYPNQRSMHSCGILISEEPITNYTTLEMP